MKFKSILVAAIKWTKSQWGILFILPVFLSLYSIRQTNLSLERSKPETVTEWCSSNSEKMRKMAERISADDESGMGRQDFLRNLRDDLVQNLAYLRTGGLRGSPEQHIVARAVTAVAYFTTKILPSDAEWDKASEMTRNAIQMSKNGAEIFSNPEEKERFKKRVEAKLDAETSRCFLGLMEEYSAVNPYKNFTDIELQKSEFKTSYAFINAGVFYDLCGSGLLSRLVRCFKNFPVSAYVQMMEDAAVNDNDGTDEIDFTAQDVLSDQRKVNQGVRNHLDNLKLGRKYAALRSFHAAYISSSRDLFAECSEIDVEDFDAIPRRDVLPSSLIRCGADL